MISDYLDNLINKTISVAEEAKKIFDENEELFKVNKYLFIEKEKETYHLEDGHSVDYNYEYLSCDHDGNIDGITIKINFNIKFANFFCHIKSTDDAEEICSKIYHSFYFWSLSLKETLRIADEFTQEMEKRVKKNAEFN